MKNNTDCVFSSCNFQHTLPHGEANYNGTITTEVLIYL